MKEYQIRPKGIFDKYLDLAKKDAEEIFSQAKYDKFNCPACEKKNKFLFKKINFSYCECEKCKTLYVSPRPKFKYFSKYYNESKSSKFWVTDFYKKTIKSRRSKIWKPKSKLVQKYLNENKGFKNIIDIGAGYGIFLDEIKKITNKQTYALEPSKDLSEICKKKHSIIQKFVEETKPADLPKGKNFYTCFELFEHLHSPKIFIKKLSKIMKKNEILFLTTLSSTGLDIDILKEKSKAVQPPYHINFFNPFSIRFFLEKNNFKIINISTPGKLDIDILENNKQYIENNFWKVFINKATFKEKKLMQKFLQKNLLSSHMIIVCIKK